MKKMFTSLILFALFAVAVAPSAASAYSYVNSGYQYTQYNGGAVNYYNHTYTQPRNYTYTYPQYYPVYYPQYYPLYYAAPQQPVCNESYYNGSYYESWNRSPNCSDRLEDWGNRQSLPNEFLSTMYGTTYY